MCPSKQNGMDLTQYESSYAINSISKTFAIYEGLDNWQEGWGGGIITGVSEAPAVLVAERAELEESSSSKGESSGS
ncbi:UNVERIFIED_CONTAM: hypothetical protein K2H54_055849 [Gekko kuhli]